MTKLDVIWDNAPDVAKERYLAFIEEESFNPDHCYKEDCELKETLENIVNNYYLEDRSSDEGILCGIKGFNDEDKAVDWFLEAYSKYGSWILYKWDSDNKKWMTGRTKRVGKNIEIVWEKL